MLKKSIGTAICRSVVAVLGVTFAFLLFSREGHAENSLPPAVPLGTPLFTFPPTPIENVKAVIPLGNLNPGGGHVLAVDHMYLGYPNPANGGANAYPVYAMAAGEIVMAIREQVPNRPDPDYQIAIRHNKAVTVQYAHLHDLSDRIKDHLSSHGDPWITIREGFQIVFLGQLDAPSTLPLNAGEQVGITKNYSNNWDVWVTDKRVHGTFAGHGPRRYPTILEYSDLLGLGLDHPPNPGQATLNAACFIDYMAPGMKEAWFDLLASEPKGCGRADWDVNGRLRGAWFNPAIDEAAQPPLFDLEYGALSIIPDNFAPATRIQIGFGSGHPLAALDPGGLYPQTKRPYFLAMDSTPGGKINPDPARVDVTTGTVCYDLPYQEGPQQAYNLLLLRMKTARRLLIFYDPTPHSVPACGTEFTENPGSWTTTYVR